MTDFDFDPVTEIRKFASRKISAAQRTADRRLDGADPYREGFVAALSMIVSYIDKTVNSRRGKNENLHRGADEGK